MLWYLSFIEFIVLVFLLIIAVSPSLVVCVEVQKPITVQQLRAINELKEEVTRPERRRRVSRRSGSWRGEEGWLGGSPQGGGRKEISFHPSFWESKFHSTLWKLGLIISKYHLKVSDQHCGVIKYTQLEYWAYNLWERLGIYCLIILFYSRRHNLHYVSVNNEHQTLTKLPHFFLCFLNIGKCITNSNLFRPRNCSVACSCRPSRARHRKSFSVGLFFLIFSPEIIGYIPTS